MIAHSFRGEAFGCAQNLHGATYTVEAEFFADALQPDTNWVIDIGAASKALATALEPYQCRNLDDLEEFRGQNTTTEFMARHIHSRLRTLLSFQGRLRVTLHESFKAWASFEA
jgi:6-pyruvoyltetrahydropterin/6-carboxytetrahydropterin synthase